MQAAIGVACGLIGTVLKQLSNEFVQAYFASSQLGLNSKKVQDDMSFTQGLLHEAQRRGMSDNPGLQRLVQQLSAKADEAEDALDELHYFIIQDQLDGTKHAMPDLGNGLHGHARHGRHALRYTVGNCLSCFPRSRMQDGDDGRATSPNTTKHHTSGNDDPADKMSFDRVAMSKKIKSVIEEMHSLCEPVSKLLDIAPHNNNTTAFTARRPQIGSTIAQDTLYGRRAIFEKTLDDITSGIYHSETHSVLPIVGPGGIGKTTLTQHLYNDKRVEEHFAVRVWVCASTDFDVLRLTKQIHDRIRAHEKEESTTSNQANDLEHLQIYIAAKLKSKRFLIVFDDIWECNREGWEILLAPLVKGEVKGNMVLVTTRFPSKAEIVKTTNIVAICLKGLDPDDFFMFFEKIIFAGNKLNDYQGDLTDVARSIAKRLKGSPLAAKTVGGLLRKELSREHWIRVLENNEWQKQKNADDIMPSLRISYEYLPLHLKKCFPYFSLFPEDYRFDNVEIAYFWIAIGIIEKDDNYMDELVDNGFLMKEGDNMNQYYVIHDLFHELSQSVSSQECLNISSSLSFRADVIPKSIRHLSITMEDRYEGNFRGEMVKLRSKINIVNLRALMIFREYEETIDAILKDTFKETVGLRVLFIVVKSQDSFPNNFLKLIHLRYLNICTPDLSSEVALPNTLSRFYHLKLLNLRRWYGSTKLPKDFSRLINLRHFVARDVLHSNVHEIGNIKYLQELKKFCVKKESTGFELSELGQLMELGGELSIYNLERVATKEEALKTKLVSKGHLKELRLVWGIQRHQGESGDLHVPTELSEVLDGLEPHPNLQSLVIENHGGSAGPSWLCADTSILMLKTLHLVGVSWATLPPFGQLSHLTSLTLGNIYEVREFNSSFGGATDRSFFHLKEIFLYRLPKLTEWVGAPSAHSFSRLEKIRCIKCPNLYALPFLQECSVASYNHLSEIEIKSCPKLFLPPMPHTSTLTRVDVFASPVGRMAYDKHILTLTGYRGALALHNMGDKVKTIIFEAGSKIPWAQLRNLASLSKLAIRQETRFLSMALLSNLTSLTWLELVDCNKIEVGESNPLITTVNLKVLEVYNNRDQPRSIAADLFSELVVASRTKQLLPAAGCFRLETLSVDSISAVLVAPICSLLAATLHDLNFWYDPRMESFTEKEENALQLLTSLQYLAFFSCSGLPSLPQGLHSLSSLRNLNVCLCPEIRSLPNRGLPASLQELYLVGCSAELQEQAQQIQGMKPDLRVRT